MSWNSRHPVTAVTRAYDPTADQKIVGSGNEDDAILDWMSKNARALPVQTPRRVISCWGEQPNRVYTTSEWVFVPEWKSRPGTVTGVNSRRYDSLWYEILCLYHVNEYRATRGNWGPFLESPGNLSDPISRSVSPRKLFGCFSKLPLFTIPINFPVTCPVTYGRSWPPVK